ncbi:unnamed protein product [Didymodactylos carnosus]|uniref:Uncharacterized protein n=1 Tax=Didymodactylos carnosus TaxID=1234261 RepID=A0A814JFH6_9BILA|nr:unnamed protein product [Didymodactylos carnosus]CAF3808088.1 unnamed protein product [Didymodactylos carnosus]
MFISKVSLISKYPEDLKYPKHPKYRKCSKCPKYPKYPEEYPEDPKYRKYPQDLKYPKCRTMDHILKSNVYPTYLRPLEAILIPSPYDTKILLKAMVKLRSNIFYTCEGNTFLHRENRRLTKIRRLPYKQLRDSYPFVNSQYD